MKKIIILTIAVIILISLSFNCSKEKAQSGKKKIGVTLLARAHQFYKDLEEGLKKSADKYGYELFVYSADFDLGKQISQIEDLITKKVDAMIVCPADSKGIGPGIKKANEAKIPVFTADITAADGEVVTHIASDNKAGGAKAGEFLVKALNGKGKIAIINHPTVTSVLDRVAGFSEVVSKYPDIQIVADVDGNGERDKSLKCAADILQAHPDINAIFGINDDSALGALAAVKEVKKDKIIIVGYDATPEACDAIMNNTNLKADVVQYPKIIGEKTIDAINQFFSTGKSVKIIPVEVGIVDKESLQKNK